MATTAVAPDAIVEPGGLDPRPRWRRMVGPGLTSAAIVAGAAVLVAVDPNEPGHYPVCPMRAIFGVDCPACGALRGTHDLLVGNVAAAAHHNVLLFIFIPVGLVLLARWFRRAWTGWREPVTAEAFRRRNRRLIVTLVLVLVFGVVRNLVPVLSSTG